ncbi:MAG: winged helix-turn-helix domain-containing protein [Acidobacteriota bacterium]
MNHTTESSLGPSSLPGEGFGSGRVTFGPFELDFHRLSLSREGQPVPLQQLRVRALCLLVARAGEVVSREDFITELWGPTLVEYDQSLPPIIRNLREVLGDSAHQPQYIQTVRGQGYRFLAPVEASSTPAPARRARRRWPVIAAAAFVLTSAVAFVMAKNQVPTDANVMVLPFESSDSEQGELIAFSVSQDLKERWANRLAVSTALRAETPDSEMQASHLIRGRIAETVTGVEALAEIVEVESGRILETASFQFVPNRLASLAYVLNDALVRPLISPSLDIPAPDETASLEIQVGFQLSRGGPANHDIALALVRRALADNPDDPQALGLLAVVQFDRWHAAPNPEAAEESARAARRSLQLAPQQVPARVALASLALYREHNPEEAYEHLAQLAGRAEHEPRYWALVAALELARGNREGTREAALQLSELTPFHPGLASEIDWFLYASGDFECALEHAEKGLTLAYPYDAGRLVRIVIFQNQGRWSELAEETRLFLEPRGIPQDTIATIVEAIRDRGQARLLWQLLHHRFEAIHATTPLFPELGALTAAGAGEHQRALAYLRQGWEQRTPLLPAALQFQLFDPLRDQPEFIALQREVRSTLELDRPWLQPL